MGQDDQDRTSENSDEIAATTMFEMLKSLDIRTERRIFWHELLVIQITAVLATAYLVASLISLGIISMPQL